MPDTEGEQGALLSPKQRAYLKGEWGGGSGADTDRARAKRARALDGRIRTRVRWGMYDFILLLGQLAADQRARIFNEKASRNDERGLVGTVPIVNTIIDALGFFFLVLADLDDDSTATSSHEFDNKYDAAAEKFGELLAEGITRAFTRVGESVENVEVAINIDRGESLSDLADQPLTEHSERVLTQLLEAEKITPAEYGEVMQERVRDRRGYRDGGSPDSDKDPHS